MVYMNWFRPKMAEIRSLTSAMNEDDAPMEEVSSIIFFSFLLALFFSR